MKSKILSGREAVLIFTPLLVLIVPLVTMVSIPQYTWNPLVRARENARRDSCRSNLKQIGLGLLQYSEDYDGKFPINTKSPVAQGWAYEIQPYTKSCPIQVCPSDSGFRWRGANCVSITSYWMNSNCIGKPTESARRSDFINQAHTFLHGDGDGAVGTDSYALNQASWIGQSTYARRHMDGSNFLFADGHVKWLQADFVQANKNLSPDKTSATFLLK